MPRRGRWASLS